jgi:cytochrome c oxidase subunit II
MRRRTLLLLLLGAGAALAQKSDARVVRITARKFEFSPAEVTLKSGEPVVFELSTEDVAMGFSAAELNLHAEIVPGEVTRVPFTPGRTGRFEYICDIFCGEGHEDMAGVIKIEA